MALEMRILVAIVLIFLVSPAIAQTPPKAVKTLRVERAPLYTIETAASTASLTDHDVARALIAVRDGKALAMP